VDACAVGVDEAGVHEACVCAWADGCVPAVGESEQVHLIVEDIHSQAAGSILQAQSRASVVAWPRGSHRPEAEQPEPAPAPKHAAKIGPGRAHTVSLTVLTPAEAVV
jgi:hypothetical protein